LPAWRFLLLAALAFASRAFAEDPAPLTLRAIREMTPSAVARRLIGPEHAADVERIETQPNWGMLPGALQVRLFHRPVPVGRNYCSQSKHQVVLFTAPPTRDVPDDATLRVQYTDEINTLARASDCRLRTGQQFASLGVDADVAMRALDNLASAQATAVRGGRLPFRLSCRDEVDRDPDKCRSGARAALAHLPLDLACSVDLHNSENVRTVEVILCPEVSMWMITMREIGIGRGRLTMLWEDIPPF
jgi:hypothetical protein